MITKKETTSDGDVTFTHHTYEGARSNTKVGDLVVHVQRYGSRHGMRVGYVTKVTDETITFEPCVGEGSKSCTWEPERFFPESSTVSVNFINLSQLVDGCANGHD